MRQLPLLGFSQRDYSLRRTPWRPVAMLDKRRTRQQRRWPAWLRDLQRFAGVYLVRDAGTKEIVYVGKAKKNLKETICRHLYAWGRDRRGLHKRVVFERGAVEVRVIALLPRFVDYVEAALIQKHRPVGNTRMEWVHTRDYAPTPF